MASPSPSSPYTMPRASTTATLHLVNPDTHPNSPQRHRTDHYERAAASAATQGTIPSSTARGAAAVVDQAGVARQQSWKMSELKGHRQGEVVEKRAGVMGYQRMGEGK